MNMNINNINTTKLISHATTISQIKIPMIQRDYVQGLEENNNKLDRFLDALYNIINSNNINDILSLDFIYGKINNDGIFEPIDGQQRLTTLALLNFYFFCKQENNTYVQNAFEYITYTTRQSAEKFCKILSSKDFIEHFKNNISNKKPSSIINEYHKYFKEYNDDTTIVAMINALDKIHDKFKNLEISKYKNIDKITFNILPMNNFNLSDDLYIKMNGRGKQLSNFDNFKADYFKWLENEQHNLSELSPDNMDIETLKNKFNTDYIDIFWDFAVRDDNEQIPDPESLFFKFINRFVIDKILKMITDTSSKKDDTLSLPNKYLDKEIAEYIKQKYNKDLQQYSEEEQKKISKQFMNDIEKYFFDDNNVIKIENNSIIYSRFDFYEFILIKYNRNLINLLNKLYKIKETISHHMKATWQKNFNIFGIFKYKQLFVYNTIFSFLENELSIDQIKNNLNYVSRLVWNIAEQYNISVGIDKDTYRTIADRFEFLYNLSFDINNNENTTINIYQNFINANIDYKGNQLKIIVDDEIRKCNYIIEDEIIRHNNMIDNESQSIEKKLIELESLPELKGSIGFLLGNQIKDFNDIYNIALEIFGENKEIDININNSNSYFNRYILLNYFKKYNMEKKYNETLFTIPALKSKLISDKDIRSIAYNFVKEIKEKKYNNLCHNIIPSIENFKKEYNQYTKIYDILLYDSILMLLYATENNSFLLNNYYILDKFLPCIIKKKYHKKDYKGYRANKRRESEFANSTIQEIIIGIEEISKHNNIELVTHKKKISYHINFNDKISVFSNIVAETSTNRIQISFNINNKPYLVYINSNSIGFQCEYKKIKSIYYMIEYIDDLQNAANDIKEIIIKLAENKEAQFQDIAIKYYNKDINGFKSYNLAL